MARPLRRASGEHRGERLGDAHETVDGSRVGARSTIGTGRSDPRASADAQRDRHRSEARLGPRPLVERLLQALGLGTVDHVRQGRCWRHRGRHGRARHFRRNGGDDRQRRRPGCCTRGRPLTNRRADGANARLRVGRRPSLDRPSLDRPSLDRQGRSGAEDQRRDRSCLDAQRRFARPRVDSDPAHILNLDMPCTREATVTSRIESFALPQTVRIVR